MKGRTVGEDKAGEEDEKQEEQPCDGVGHNQGAPNGAHEPEEADGHLVAQEVEQPKGKVPVCTHSPKNVRNDATVSVYGCAECTSSQHAWVGLLLDQITDAAIELWDPNNTNKCNWPELTCQVGSTTMRQNLVMV